MKRKILEALLGVCLMATLFGGCGKNSDVENNQTSVESGVSTSEIAHSETEVAETETETEIPEQLVSTVKGEVLVTKETTYDTRNSEEGEMFRQTINEYDEKGNMLKTTTYFADGAVMEETTYAYDDSGNMLRSSYFLCDYDGYEVKEFEYDGNNNLLEESNYWETEGEKVFYNGVSYRYDGNNNMIEKTTHENIEGGIRDYTICYEYDTQNNLVKEYIPAEGDYIDYTYNNGNVTYIYSFNFIAEGVTTVEETFFEYDAHGNMLLKEERKKNKLERKITWEYNSKNQVVKETYYDKNEELKNWLETEYDYYGNKIKYTSYDKDGSINYWNAWEYDEYGTLTKEINYTSYNDHTQIDLCYDYEYDDNGVAVKRINYEMFSDTEINGWTDIEYIVIPEE